MAHPWTLQHMLAAVDYVKGIDNPVGSATDWWKLYDEMIKEVRDGVCVKMSIVSVIGQKQKEVKGNLFNS